MCFFNCSRILPLRESLSTYVYNATSERIVFDISNVIFGEKPSGDIAVNFILLNTKQFIFRCLKQSKLPTFHGLLVHLKFKYNVEQYIARKRFKIEKFNNIWNKWNLFFQLTHDLSV